MKELKNVHLVARSSNSKTGDIPVTYRGQSTCPSTCPFLNNGCYGDGRLWVLAHKYVHDLAMADAMAILAKVRKGARYLRDRVLGDIVTESGGIDWDYLVNVSWLAHKANLVPFGYTHAWELFDRASVRRVRSFGYVMNASTETPRQVELAIMLGMPTVITNGDLPEGEIIAGKRVITCPAQVRDGITCATCGLCAKGDRKVIIRFIPHGPSRKRAESAIARANA